MPDVISYTVAADPLAHEFVVSCVVAKPATRGQVFSLPSWIRGSYLVRDFAKHVSGLTARAGARELTIRRLDKRSFRCAPARGPVTLSYRVYAYDESVRKAFLDTRRGFFNGSSLFYLPAGAQQSVFEVRIGKPDNPACREWKVATALPAKKIARDGFGLYRAQGYEELIDCPVELGAFERLDFEAGGVPHALVLSGRYELDRERVTRDLARICQVERDMFGGQPKMQQYLFLTNVTGAGYGGLEHKTSTALICSRADLPRPGVARLGKDYRGFLGLCSHEYFHLWNVKRITAKNFLDSDLATEAYTADLWHYEGVTSYYDDLFLLRAGVLDAPAYLDVVAETATRLARSPGRGLHTLADASFEAWIKYYQPDEHSPNVTVNYYVKGALAALCVDLTLRLKSKSTLDDVMRALWQRYGAKDIGVPEGGLEKIAQEISGLKLKPLFDRLLRSTQELPLAELLAEFGVESTQRAQLTDADNGGRASGDAPAGYIGVRLKPGEARVAHVLAGGPAARAGLAGNDMLLALDGIRLGAGTLGARLAHIAPGRQCTLHYFRGDELLSATLTVEAPPQDTWALTLAPAAGDVLARRKAWLGA